MPYEYLNHQADLGIRGIGTTPEEALSQGAQAMVAAMADTEHIQERTSLTQRCRAPDIASLFIEWLNELLYQRQVNDLLFASARVVRLEQDDRGWLLEGIATGEPLDLNRHKTHTEIKAATYSGLSYRCEPERCVIQCIVDV
jgi:tRNA nucleotidyltransferase (CCA-adding enzyme)